MGDMTPTSPTSSSTLDRRALLLGLGASAFANAATAAPMATPLISRRFASPRHTTQYLECGPSDGPLLIFLHGWPELGLIWRAQMNAFAQRGWHCIAPDMRGYGGSSAPDATSAYANAHVVDDMAELHDHLGGKPAIWVGMIGAALSQVRL